MLEEAEGGRGDCERALVVPDDEGVVELLCNCKCGEIPWLEEKVRLDELQGRQSTYVTALVDIFGVPTGGDGSVGGNARVDRIDGTERIDIDL